MTNSKRTASYIRTFVPLFGVVLPSLSLIPFGSLWLWQHGYLLHWALATAVLVGLFSALCSRFLGSNSPQMRNAASPATSASAAPPDGDDAIDPLWRPAEVEAWADVQAFALRTDAKALASQDAVLMLGADAVQIVAKRLHPEVAEPLWHFTVPEALALSERVSRRLSEFVVESVPFSERLTVAQVLALYRWRGAFGVAEKAYDVWRFVRLVNPVTAVTHELRERLSKQMVQLGREHITQRLARAYIREVGRAAIDLYGGRLRVSDQQMEVGLSTSANADSAAIMDRTAEPLRILIAGQSGAGKSSLINALGREVLTVVDALPATSDFTPYQLEREGFPTAILIDSPGLGQDMASNKKLLETSDSSDLILWVMAAHRADRDIDCKALVSLRQRFQARPQRQSPPIVVVLSHIDRLRPFNEWAPPYDINAGATPKAISIKAAIAAAAHDIGVDPEMVIPVGLATGSDYNIDALWAAIAMVLPDAKRARLTRRLEDSKAEWDWRQVWKQASNAGRVIGRTMR